MTIRVSDLSSKKVRPAVIVSAPHVSQDVFITPLTSKTESLLEGEFVLIQWREAGLNIASAVKRGVFTLDARLIVKRIGKLESADAERLEKSLRAWLGF